MSSREEHCRRCTRVAVCTRASIVSGTCSSLSPSERDKKFEKERKGYDQIHLDRHANVSQDTETEEVTDTCRWRETERDNEIHRDAQPGVVQDNEIGVRNTWRWRETERDNQVRAGDGGCEGRPTLRDTTQQATPVHRTLHASYHTERAQRCQTQRNPRFSAAIDWESADDE